MMMLWHLAPCHYPPAAALPPDTQSNEYISLMQCCTNLDAPGCKIQRNLCEDFLHLGPDNTHPSLTQPTIVPASVGSHIWSPPTTSPALEHLERKFHHSLCKDPPHFDDFTPANPLDDHHHSHPRPDCEHLSDDIHTDTTSQACSPYGPPT